MEAIIGDKLQSKEGIKPTSEYTADYFAIYIGAHWAPPCRKFNNDLKTWYEFANAGCGKKKNVEVIFVSLDGNEAHFNRHFAMMPWLALPYEDEARVAALKIRFEIKALPTLVVLDSKGEKISEDARQEVTSAGQSEEAAKTVLTSWEELLKAPKEEEVKA